MVEGINSSNESEENSASEENNDNENHSDDLYVPVQEYTGEGYDLANGKETDRIANENRDVVEDGVKQFFQEEYKTEVKVHQIVGNVDGATVFVESVGEPHFYTYAIVPIDKANETIMVDKVWSQEAAVERAISSSIYGMVMKDEFQQLNRFIESINAEYQLTGLNKKAIPVASGQNFSNSFYFMNVRTDRYFEPIFEKYMQNPDRTAKEWAEVIDNKKIDPSDITISINLYMAEKNKEPNQEALQALVQQLEETEKIPKGYYSVYLHDNTINKQSPTGNKDNTLERAHPEEIIKE
ncbi:DUF1672 family protein [Paraliobacillus ryukyuensis]|uniref:DUF1672 family protein n=1 Tax=Paraliobacillus ryukyuensis TaxID=200904 RepID=UPI0021173082|nr:DUF1672 family protein [Paraliobacillus ryukyuensis]